MTPKEKVDQVILLAKTFCNGIEANLVLVHGDAALKNDKDHVILNNVLIATNSLKGRSQLLENINYYANEDSDQRKRSRIPEDTIIPTQAEMISKLIMDSLVMALGKITVPPELIYDATVSMGHYLRNSNSEESDTLLKGLNESLNKIVDSHKQGIDAKDETLGLIKKILEQLTDYQSVKSKNTTVTGIAKQVTLMFREPIGNTPSEKNVAIKELVAKLDILYDQIKNDQKPTQNLPGLIESFKSDARMLGSTLPDKIDNFYRETIKEQTASRSPTIGGIR